MTETTEGSFEGWVLLEIMGHRKLGGYFKEQTIADVSFIRLDVISVEGKTIATQFYNPSSIYCITPTTQEIAVHYGVNNQPVPVARWELPESKPPDKTELVWYDESVKEEDDDDIPV